MKNANFADYMKAHWPVSLLSILSSLINMALPLILVRIFDPSTLGTFKVFFLYLMVLPPLTFIAGVSSGLSYWAGRGEEGKRAIRISGILFLIISLFTLFIGLVFQNGIAGAIHVNPMWIQYFAIALFLGIAGLFYDDAAIATGKIWTGAIFNSGFEFLRTSAIVLTALLTRDLLSVIKIHILIYAIKVCTGYTLAYRQNLFHFEWDSGVFRSVLRYAFPVSLAWFFGLGLNYSDQIILSKVLSTADFAVYAVCCLSVPPLLVFEASVNRVLIPQLSQSFSEGKNTQAAAMFRKSVRELGFLMIPAVVGMMIFAEPIIELLFTKTYLSGAHYLRIYALWYLSLMIPQDVVARAQGNSRWILGNFISFSVLTLALCFAFGRWFGVVGVLEGLLISRFLSRFYTIYYIHRTLSWSLPEILPLESLARFSLHCIGLAAFSLLSKPLFHSSLQWFFVMGGLFTVVYFAITLGHLFKREAQSRRVLMLTPGLFIGGLERMILNLSRTLKTKSIWRPQVLAYDFQSHGNSSDLIGAFNHLEIPVMSSSKPPRFSLKTVAQIAGQTSRDEITVLHTHDLGALVYGALAKFFLGNHVRLVHTQHSFVHLNRSWKYRYYEKFFTRFADAIAVVSDDTKKSYLELGVPEDKIFVIPNGVEFPIQPDLDRTTRMKNRPAISFQSDFWIVYLARIHRRKGQDHALELWEKLTPECRLKSTLIFVGPETDPGELKRLKEITSRVPNSDRIQFVGASQNPHEWIQAADVFLSASEFEGMPLSPVEAIGSGVPSVLSRIPGHEFLAPYADLYLLEQPEKGAEFVERLVEQTFSNDSGLREAVWIKMKRLRESFTLETMAKNYQKLYEAKS